MQRISGLAGLIVDIPKRILYGVASILQDCVALMFRSYAEPLVKLSKLKLINDRKSFLVKILDNYAQNYRNTSPKDRDKINSSMVKPFDKMAVNQESGTSNKGYYKCVDDSSIRSFDLSPEFLFDRLLRPTDLRNHPHPHPHPQGISSLAFAFAAILALTLHRESTSESDLRNETTPYFDLSPLDGTSAAETNRIRKKDGSGMLEPDSFAEKRLDMLPDSVPVLLVLWNRYHNYVAKQLLSYNENNKWIDPGTELQGDQRMTQDDEIFKLAQSITRIHFINVIREDFLRGLTGMSMIGPSTQVDILKLKVKDEKIVNSTMESYLLYSFSSFTPWSFAPEGHVRVREGKGISIDPDVKRRRFGTLSRNREKHDRFDDNDLAELLFDAVEAHAGSPGDRVIPDWERERDISKLKEARQTNVCTLNEFRRYLGLKPLKSFQEWNPKLADVASNHMTMISTRLNYTLASCVNLRAVLGLNSTWGLIADIVTRIRRDPVFTSDFDADRLTNWGYNDCQPYVETNSNFCNTAGSFGAMLSKLLRRTLPDNCPYDNVYCLFPFIVPEKIKAYMKEFPEANKKYQTDRPKPVTIKVLQTLKAISQVLNDPQKFPSPYKQNLIELTGGYGHMLGFDDLTLHDRDLMLTLFSLMPDKGAVRRIGKSFARNAFRNLRSRSLCAKYKVIPEPEHPEEQPNRGAIGRIFVFFARIVFGNVRSGVKDKRKPEVVRIDVIKDVIDATCVRWVCETICSLRFKDDSIWGMSEAKIGKARKESREMEEKERENFASYYAYIFRNIEPEFQWSMRETALTASEHLRQHLNQKIPREKDQPISTRYIPYTRRMLVVLWRFIIRLYEEFVPGKMLPRHSSLTFLDRMVKKSYTRPLKHLADETDHLSEMKEMYKQEARPEIEAKASRTSVERIPKEDLLKQTLLDDGQIPEHKIEDIASRKLEEQRVIANVMGLAAVVSAQFSKVCAQAVEFYLDDKYSSEREELVKLCRDPGSLNEEIMGYIWEAQRIGQRFGLWRNVNLPPKCEKMIIEQGHGYPPVTIEPGDRVYADFTFAHNDPKQVVDPKKVDPSRNYITFAHNDPKQVPVSQGADPRRKLNSLLGLGLHKCPAGSFINQTMPEIFRVIFKQENLKRASDRLKATTLYPHEEPWHSEVYLNEDNGFDYCPKSMIIEFDAEGIEVKDWETRNSRAFHAYRLLLGPGIAALYAGLFAAIVQNHHESPPPIPSRLMLLNVHCPQPLKTVEDWHIKTFRPQYGLFGEPAPITYQTPKGRKVHQVSMIDIDKRDIDLRVWVNNEDYIPFDVDLDQTVDCSDDIRKCLDLKFSSAVVIVPPGGTVKAEIRKRDPSEKFDWGGEREKRIMWMVQECA